MNVKTTSKKLAQLVKNMCILFALERNQVPEAEGDRSLASISQGVQLVSRDYSL
ncbi:hypothetical protein GCM10010916_33330 [Paenibacillus abyssi]|uniref:Uncharacterized protein n=1 Tax=Paenibacillus abyssi TaxID=1340531 RepID=A0A917D7F8_9BACL|nr:hypothetical protein GCM10010916_33330 [Paenibacillus abyssi]